MKTALITGGSRGLGRDAALRLAEKGNDIIITYLTKQKAAEEVVKQIRDTGNKAAAIQFDAGDTASLPSFINHLREQLTSTFNTDKFDYLINNAGTGATIPFADVTEADFDKLLNIHFKGVYFLTQQCLPLMNNGGSIVNLSSGTTRFANPGYSVYASMKGAIEVLTKYLAKDLGPRDISVNVVAPGPIATDFNNAFVRDNPEVNKRLASVTALGRVGQAEDIGGIIAFLCSAEGHWINAQRIEASGGINL